MKDPDPTRVFAPLAADYAASRPGYPASLVTEIARRAPADPALVVDLAAGTGAASETLLEGGLRVVAVEPALAMLERAEARLGTRPGWVGGVAGRGEAIPLADGVAGVVVVAQAFHWLDPVPALEEISRVLAPTGVLAVVWYIVEPDPVTRAARDLLRRHGSSGGRPVTAKMRRTAEPLAAHPGFEVEPPVELDHAREMTAERYVTFARSWSYGGGALGEREWEAYERDLRAAIAELHGDAPWTERLLVVAHFARRRVPR